MAAPELTDDERAQWVDKDVGLYALCHSSRESKAAWIRKNRATIDKVIRSVRDGARPAHYLKYRDELTEDEREALVEAVELALEDQRQYLSIGSPQVDYGEEWPQVAAEKARRFRLMASVMRKFGMPAMGGRCDQVALDFEEEAKP